jgi:hypothetical protein
MPKNQVARGLYLGGQNNYATTVQKWVRAVCKHVYAPVT